VTLALQAYLDRTSTDIKKVIEKGINVRLVKGAYFGDTSNFVEIQSRFRKLVTILSESDVEFCVGTQDPELIEWVRGELINKSDKFEFGLLKGLGDKTKHLLVNEGWNVSEYVPFGSEISAYEMRRERYLKELYELGRLPVP
jgi:proline dehydrogenase